MLAIIRQKKLEKNGIALNEQAVSLARDVDRRLPPDLQHVIKEQLYFDDKLKRVYARSYALFSSNTFTKSESSQHEDLLASFDDKSTRRVLDNCGIELLVNEHYQRRIFVHDGNHWIHTLNNYFNKNETYFHNNCLAFDAENNILWSLSEVTSYETVITSYFPPRVWSGYPCYVEIKSWRPQCNLPTMLQEGTVADWVLLSTPAPTITGKIKSLFDIQ